jgi:hypothetical protein
MCNPIIRIENFTGSCFREACGKFHLKDWKEMTMSVFLETYIVKKRDGWNWLRRVILLHCQFLKYFLSSFFTQNDIDWACDTYGGQDSCIKDFDGET